MIILKRDVQIWKVQSAIKDYWAATCKTRWMSFEGRELNGKNMGKPNGTVDELNGKVGESNGQVNVTVGELE